jgi:hypothetical protein
MAFQKYKRPPRKINRAIKKNHDSIQSLADGLLTRHGIKRQVEAASVVKGAEQWFTVHLPEHAVQDVIAISYAQDILTIGCMNHGAMHLMQSLRSELHTHLVSALPHICLTTIRCRLLRDSERENKYLRS